MNKEKSPQVSFIDTFLAQEKEELNMKYLKVLWTKIKIRRNKKCMTQKQLARELWIDRWYYWLIENGKTNPTFLILKKILIILEMDVVISCDKEGI